ncbi:DoxX family protein [Pedobacter yulinensis]|uniref:DoxX family protein n=1 Tax=Pedobacter yulinensis TaxID=2126353 RepID=A0A2T3HL31_9SPHI|nr:DoxX family protein [Pedobacter yulinensis]PST83134.1 DoxX family protein [Pedobacter yulinensis]
MKTLKITYWVSTGIIVLMMLFSVYNYLSAPAMKQGFEHLGFPDWFRVELAIAKLLGLLALGIPGVPARVKEWAYAGFSINFISAFLAHNQAGDPAQHQVTPLVILLILVVSYVCHVKLTAGRLPGRPAALSS